MAIGRWLRVRRRSLLRATVIVPVYNAGTMVDDLIASLDRQSLPDRDYESIFVDDGSTDDTLQRLRDAASERPHMSVTSIPNSGWPGRPRNVGIDMARGTYVFFADQDDELFPQALQRMCDMADCNGSDIVYGKIVRPGAATPYWTWGRGDVDRADLLTEPALSSRTVHKLFRRSFLVDNDVRFPEGRVRLEDHHFMGQAIAANPVVSVLESYPCYRWINRGDGTNNSAQAIRFDTYLDYWSAALDVVRSRGGPRALSVALAVPSFGQLLGKLNVAQFAHLDADEQGETFALLAAVAKRLFPPEIDERLPVLKRLRLQALRADDQGTYLLVQGFKDSIGRDVTVTNVRPRSIGIRIDVRGRLTMPGTKSALAVDADGRDVLAIPGLDGGYDNRLLEADRPRIEITVRHHKIGTEWHIESGTGHLDEVSCSGLIDPLHAVFGKKLDYGTWQVMVRTSFLGEASILRAPLGTDVMGELIPVVAVSESVSIAAESTKQRTLAVRVERSRATADHD